MSASAVGGTIARAGPLRELGHPDKADAADRRALELTANPAARAALGPRLTQPR